MKNSLFLAMLLGLALLLGCVSPETGGGTSQAQEEAEREPFSARAGLDEAKSAASSIAPDAALILVYGFAESDGKSAQWEYTFNSMQNRKSYTITIPGKFVRERPYSFSDSLPSAWPDSAAASSTCHMPGEYSLEMKDGTATWTVAFEGNVCESTG